MRANQIITSKRTDKWMTAGMCVGASVVLHAVVVIMICLRIIILQTEPLTAIDAEEEILENEDVVVAIQLDSVKPQPVPMRDAPLTPKELKALAVKKPPVEKANEKSDLTTPPQMKLNELQKYARTAADQLSGEVPDTSRQGERDTIEASNRKIVASAPDRAAVRGEKAKDREQETVDTTFQDGVLEQMNKGGDGSQSQVQTKPPSEEVVDPEKLAKIDQEQIKSSVESTRERGEALEKRELATSNKEQKEFLETHKKIALNEEVPTSNNTGKKENKGLEEQKKTIANHQPDPDAMKDKSQDGKEKRQETLPKVAENKRVSQNSKKGFRSEAKATLMEGTISRRSKIASKNVKATPVGKYMAKISKLVEQEWQRRCMMHADLIQPGTLRIGFMVDERGKVKNIITITQTMGSESQRSLTFQALTSVKIPSMPKEVKRIQGGDPLQFRYYFRFQ